MSNNPASEALKDAREYCRIFGVPWSSCYPRDYWYDGIRQGYDDIRNWYRSEVVSRAYIRELAEWHSYDTGVWKTCERVVQATDELCLRLDIPKHDCKVLDYGAGIGTSAIWLAREGYNVDCYEIGTELQKLIQWRSVKWNVQDKINLVYTPRTKYHVVVALDVIEHLEWPMIFPAELLSMLVDRGILIATWNFTDGKGKHPMHATGYAVHVSFKMELTAAGFEKIKMPWNNNVVYNEWPVVYELKLERGKEKEKDGTSRKW